MGEIADVQGAAVGQLSMSRTLMFVFSVDWFFCRTASQLRWKSCDEVTGCTSLRAWLIKLDEMQRNGLVIHLLVLDRSIVGLGNAWCSFGRY